jgi:hypothetical protein
VPSLPSPRARFLKNEALAAAHAAIAGSTAFQSACDIALQQYMYTAPVTTNPEESAAIAQRIIGAREYIGVLLNLADPVPELPPRAQVGRLDPDA